MTTLISPLEDRGDANVNLDELVTNVETSNCNADTLAEANA